MLGPEQKAWFLERLRASTATWKVWGNSLGTLDWRADPQNLPAGLTKPWPGAGYACFGGGGDWGAAYTERGRDLRRRARGGHHRLRHRLGRPPQLLGRPRRRRRCRPRPSSRSASRSSPARSRRRASSRPTSTASPRTIRCARCTCPRSSGRPQPADQPAAAPRRALVPRVPAQRRPAPRARARRTRTWRRTSPSWTWAATATRRCASAGDAVGVRVRLHPAAARAQRDRRRRAAALPGLAPRGAVAQGRDAAARARRARGRPRPLRLTLRDRQGVLIGVRVGILGRSSRRAIRGYPEESHRGCTTIRAP